MKELNIQVPEGYEVDKEKSTFEKIIFKKIENKLPKTWEEFCEQNSDIKGEYYIGLQSNIMHYQYAEYPRAFDADRNLLLTKEDTEAHLALIQLHRLRDVYRQGWVKYSDGHCYNIVSGYNGLYISDCGKQRFLSFQSVEIAQEFLINFRDLIEKAKNLI